MVEAMRRACDQLYARTRIIGGVVEATAVRLEAESGLGYMKQLRRLNRLLLERSAKMLGVRQEADVDAVSHGSESGRMQLANYAELASLAAEEEAASSMSTPPGRHPSLSSTATTTMASSTLDSPRGAGGSSGSGSQNPQQRTTGVHRRKRRCQAYSLLTHLRRWESALAGETTAILTACAKGIGSADVTPSLSPVRCIQDIRDLLLVA
ncbi:hypothetical protein DQ04_06831000 [Trypanosoma grayi]|uniref:hypothetical protein n=1 Tax=Trypanosoma grayi TaxID=71804 RepID=UPI0004F434E2|nr:hypothetical protein DQ04_06831000 [Trypanosoma grayi]KEG08598.1 hypothetical protein DQ04_06831000 [Trypanosoma grayi]